MLQEPGTSIGGLRVKSRHKGEYATTRRESTKYNEIEIERKHILLLKKEANQLLPRVNKSVFATMCLCYLFSTTIRCFILCSRLKHLKRLIKKKSNCTTVSASWRIRFRIHRAGEGEGRRILRTKKETIRVG